MSWPFIRHPSFNEYIDWAISQGCVVEYTSDQTTGQQITKIVSPTGKYARATIPVSEILSVNSIRRLDNRLEIQSEWLRMDQVE